MLKIAWSPSYKLDLPPGHRFPMEKYELLPEQLLWEGTVREEQFFAPPPLPVEAILRAHEPDYWQRLSGLQLTAKEMRRVGFPLSQALVQREVEIMNGTVMAADFALQYGCALNIAGGTHHAFTDRGEGFCLLNDIALAARYLTETKGFQRILVIDLDVHQGNGTAQIFRDDPRVFTFSVHGANNYPAYKEQSDWDIGVPDGIEDEAYLALLNEALPQLIDLVEPQFIFYQCGVDILESDKLGRLKVSAAGCKERDRLVWHICHKNGIPVVASMGGGYSARIADIVEAHANTFRLAQEIFF